METLNNQSVTTTQTNVLSKVVVLILNVLCGITIYCLLKLAGIRPEFADVYQLLAGVFGAITLITWLAWPAKK